MTPLGLVDNLAGDISHGGVGLGRGCAAPHHPGDVQVLDDQFFVLPGQGIGHLVYGVPAEAVDAPVAFGYSALRFPPAPGSLGPAGLGSLPSDEFALHTVVGLGILVGLAVGVGGVGVDACVDGSSGARVRLQHWFRCFPAFQAYVPAAVLPLDVGLVIYPLITLKIDIVRYHYAT